MSELIAIYGARGGGKSTLARELTRKAFRLIVLDPSRDWEKRRDIRQVADLPDLSKLISRHWHDGFRAVLTAPPGKDALALHRISELLCAYQEKFYRGNAREEVTLAVDEMAEAYSNADAQRDSLSGFRRIILQGRHYGISVLGISQRPADVAARFRDNAGRTYVFALHDHTSRETIAKRFAGHGAGEIGSLKKFEYLAIDQDTGTVSRGKTKKTA